MKKSTLLMVGVAALFALSSDAQAQDTYLAQVRAQLDAVSKYLFEEGYTASHEAFTGSLGNGATEDIEIDLYGGVAYALLGVCDVDCSDMDLVLRDASGAVVASDTEVHDVPVVMVTPQRTATYTVTVRMAACSVAPCRFGVAAYGR